MSGLSTQCWKVPTSQQISLWWTSSGAEVGNQCCDCGITALGSSYGSELASAVSQARDCSQAQEQDEEEETQSASATERSVFADGISTTSCLEDKSSDEISGFVVYRALCQPRDRQLGLCIHFCPDEPVLAEEHAEESLDRWRAECSMTKWSAMSPMSVDETGCIGGVIKNTFVHVAPPPAAMREKGAQRRSRSLPKDLGSMKSIWDATCHAFKFAPTCSQAAQREDAVEFLQPSSQGSARGIPKVPTQTGDKEWGTSCSPAGKTNGENQRSGPQSLSHDSWKGQRRWEMNEHQWRRADSRMSGWHGESWWSSNRSSNSASWSEWSARSKPAKGAADRRWSYRDRGAHW